MPGWVGDIEQETLTNETFRTVVFTGEHTQLTVMSIEPGDDIGGEVHTGHDQFLRIESGSARVELGRVKQLAGAIQIETHSSLYVIGSPSRPSHVRETDVNKFSRGFIDSETVLDGNLHCSTAGDAWVDPGTVLTPGVSVIGCPSAP